MSNNNFITLNKVGGGIIRVRAGDISAYDEVTYQEADENWVNVELSKSKTYGVTDTVQQIDALLSKAS